MTVTAGATSRATDDPLTIGDLEQIERTTGVALAQMTEPGNSLRFMAGVHWCVTRRSDPDWTFTQSLDLPLHDLTQLSELVEGVLGELDGSEHPPRPSTNA